MDCRICGNEDIPIINTTPLMPLGAQLTLPDDEHKPELFYPLHHAMCMKCLTLQAVEEVPWRLLASENTNIAGIPKTIRDRDRVIYLEAKEYLGLKPSDTVVEVGGSDGTFLENFLEDGNYVVNIEPVKIAAKKAKEKGIDCINTFLIDNIAYGISQNSPAKLVVAKHVLELVYNAKEFMDKCVTMMSDDGYLLLEVPYLPDLLNNNFFDLMAHLRMYHFTISSIRELAKQHDLVISKVVHYKALGGGIRLYLTKNAEEPPVVNTLIKAEREPDLNKYKKALKRGLLLRESLLETLTTLKMRHYVPKEKIIGYGAGIKSSVLLNYCGIDSRYLDYVVDNGEHKQGMLTPGTRLPIKSPDEIDDDVTHILILSWLYTDEIIESLDWFRKKGGKIIIPTPEVKII